MLPKVCDPWREDVSPGEMNELDIPVEEGVWGVDDTGVLLLLLLLLAGVTVFLAGVDGMPIVDGWGGGGGGSPAMTTNVGDGCAKKPLSLFDFRRTAACRADTLGRDILGRLDYYALLYACVDDAPLCCQLDG